MTDDELKRQLADDGKPWLQQIDATVQSVKDSLDLLNEAVLTSGERLYRKIDDFEMRMLQQFAELKAIARGDF